jgi:hypothetical protein
MAEAQPGSVPTPRRESARTGRDLERLVQFHPRAHDASLHARDGRRPPRRRSWIGRISSLPWTRMRRSRVRVGRAKRAEGQETWEHLLRAEIWILQL